MKYKKEMDAEMKIAKRLARRLVRSEMRKKTRKVKTKKCPVKKVETPELTDRQKKQLYKERATEIAKDLKKDGKAKLVDVGVLHVKVKPARKAKTIPKPAHWGGKPGETMRVKARPKSKVVKFRASKVLKESVNSKVKKRK